MLDITPRLSIEQAKALLKSTVSGQNRARRTFCLVKHFHPSKSEAGYCNWLFARKRLGEIEDYQWQYSVKIPIIGRNGKKRTWKIDFRVTELDGSYSYHESKGWNRSDDSFKLKRDAFLICYPNLKLFVNKELYTGKPDRKRFRWTLGAVVRRNKKAARVRKRLRINWKKANQNLGW